MEVRQEHQEQGEDEEQQVSRRECEDDAKRNEAGETMSKQQQKKLLKAQKRHEMKDAKRKYEKEKKKANRLIKKLAGEDLGKKKREANERAKKVSPARVVIDLSFDELMTERELISMGQQLGALYHSNKLSCTRFSSIIFTGPSEGSLYETTLGKRMENQGKGHWKGWRNIEMRALGGLEGLDKGQDGQEAVCRLDQLVYLTADSDSTMERVEEDKVYIIGGLVDRNRHKRLCADKAQRLGIQTTRLPINPSRLSASTVLTVNGVVDILLTYNETLDWEATFDKCLPKRKKKISQVEEREDSERDSAM